MGCWRKGSPSCANLCKRRVGCLAEQDDHKKNPYSRRGLTNRHSREVKEAETTDAQEMGDGAGWKASLEDARGSLGRRGGSQR